MTNEKQTTTTLDHAPTEPSPSNNEDAQRVLQGVVKRQSFLKSIGVAGAVLSAGVVLSSHAQATRRCTVTLPGGNASHLRLVPAVESIEAAALQAKEHARRIELEKEIQAFEKWQRHL